MPPEGVVLFALYQQRLYRVLARDTKLAAATLPQLAPSLRKVSADLLAAHRELYRLTPPLKSHTTIRVGRAPPAATLLRYYREAGLRFHVPWDVLASVNFVESLPRTATGKLQKFLIREPYWQGVERRVG